MCVFCPQLEVSGFTLNLSWYSDELSNAVIRTLFPGQTPTVQLQSALGLMIIPPALQCSRLKRLVHQSLSRWQYQDLDGVLIPISLQCTRLKRLVHQGLSRWQYQDLDGVLILTSLQCTRLKRLVDQSLSRWQYQDLHGVPFPSSMSEMDCLVSLRTFTKKGISFDDPFVSMGGRGSKGNLNLKGPPIY